MSVLCLCGWGDMPVLSLCGWGVIVCPSCDQWLGTVSRAGAVTMGKHLRDCV